MMTNFFKKVDKQSTGENPLVFMMKTKDDLIRNRFIQYGGTCETEAMKIKQAICADPIEWPVFDTSAIINKLKALK